MNWMNLPEKYRKGKFVVLPIAYENNPTYGFGASKGPAEIIKASQHLEYYDLEGNNEPFAAGIEIGEVDVKGVSPEMMIEKVADKVSSLKEKFVIGLGGDHAVTIGMVKGLEELQDDFSVIVLDAHADFFNSWNGSQYNHRCVSQRVSTNHDLAIIGVRAMDIDEKKIIDNNEKVNVVYARDFSLEKVKELLPKLKKKVYLSIDVDVFDPSFIRNTGTPEPEGLSWREVLDILEVVFKEKEVIGCDIVEFAPEENFRAEAYSLAKLVYVIMGKVYNSTIVDNKPTKFQNLNHKRSYGDQNN